MGAGHRWIVGLGALVVLGGGVLLWTTSGAGSGRSGSSASDASVEANGADAGTERVVLVGVEELDVRSVADALPRELERTKAEFAAAVKDTLTSYSLESVGEYFDWQRSQGVVPTPKLVNDPDFAQKIWDGGREILAGARFDPLSVRTRRIRDRKDVGYPDGGEYWAMRESTRDDGRPFLAMGEPLAHELIVRGRFPGADGETVAADLGLEMAWDPTGGRWVLTAIRFYHIGPPGGGGAPANFDGSLML
jgi:uncharacterized small protein (DUF1192 family)